MAWVVRKHVVGCVGFAYKLKKEGVHWGVNYGHLVKAGTLALAGQSKLAAAELERAEDGFSKAHMPVYRAVAMRRRGQLLGGDEGEELMSCADDELRTRGIVRPERLVAMLAVGVPD